MRRLCSHRRFPARRAASRARRGATLLETALVLPVALLVVLGIIESGLSIHRRNMAAWIAREMAREAAVHGSLAPPKMSAWGPQPVRWSLITRRVDESPVMSELEEVLAPFRGYVDHPDALVQIRWPDENNHWGQTVEVTVILPGQGIFVLGKMSYSATCRMEIAH